MALAGRPAHLPEVAYGKMLADCAPEALLNELIEACAACTNADEIAPTVQKFCQGKELCGPDVALLDDECLGHVKPEHRTVARIAADLEMDPSEVGHLLTRLSGEGTRTEVDLAEAWFLNEIVNGPGTNLRIANRPAWLFRVGDQKSDPFQGDLGCLPWCLGLPLWAKTKDRSPAGGGVACIGYRVPAKSVSIAKRPTVIDAGYEAISYYWEPGGMTIPHPHGPAECVGGFEEVVVEPPRLAEINRPIARFKSK